LVFSVSSEVKCAAEPSVGTLLGKSALYASSSAILLVPPAFCLLVFSAWAMSCAGPDFKSKSRENLATYAMLFGSIACLGTSLYCGGKSFLSLAKLAHILYLKKIA